MGILFISHSSHDNDQAIEVRDWLHENGWGKTFLDLDPEQGLAAGDRWQEELKKAGEDCSAVVVLVSPDWVTSLWCQVEFRLAYQLGKHIFAVIVLPTPRADLPADLTGRYQLVDISDPATKADGYNRLRLGLTGAGLHPHDFQWPPRDELDRAPYRGLSALEEKDARVFFGRDAPITRGLDALRRLRAGGPERMLVILGASGAGKSSFLKAGLLARLRRDEEQFLVLPTMRPERTALTGPLGLLRALGLPARASPEALQKRLTEIRRPLREHLQRLAEDGRETPAPRPPTLILPIDQAEELFSGDNTESSECLDVLNEVFAADKNLVAVLTIRSDSFSQLQGEPRLAEVPRLPFDLPRLSPAAFKEVIEGPGRLAKPEIQVEPALTDSLVAALDSPDALPLLAFTLERLFTAYGGDGKLELREFEEELGGLGGAINQAVEAAFAVARKDPALPNDRAALEALARRAFLPWLVSVDDADAPPKRRVTPLGGLPAETRGLVGHLVSQRLVVSDLREGETVVEVSHEAVLRNWGALATWIEEERDALRTLSAVQVAAKEWRRQSTTTPDSAQDETWLVHRGGRLSAAEELLLARPDYRQLVGDVGREYLVACRRREKTVSAEAEQRVLRERKHLERQRALQRRAAFALLLVALVVAAFATFAVRQSRKASRQVSLVLADYSRRALAEGKTHRAVRLAALAAREGVLTVADQTAVPALAAAAQRSPLVLELRGHEKGVDGLVISPDRTLVLTWSEDGTARTWNVATGAEIARAKHAASVLGGLFDATGKRVLSWDGAGEARIWNAATGATLAARKHGWDLGGALFDPAGERVLSWGNGGLVVWRAADGVDIATSMQERGVVGGWFDATGKRVLSWSDDVAHVWDATTGTEIARAHQTSGVRGAVFDAAGKRVLSWGNGEVAARVWDAATGDDIAASKHAGGAQGATFAPDAGRVLSWGSAGVWVWDIATGNEVMSSKAPVSGVEGAMFDAAGKQVLSWGGEEDVWVWDAATGAEIASSTHQGGGVVGATFDTAGERVLSWGGDGIAQVWSATTDGTQIAVSSHEKLIEGAMFDASGKHVLSWDEGGTARVWDAATSDILATTEHADEAATAAQADGVDGAMFDADGKRVFSWGQDGTAQVWSAVTAPTLAATTHLDRVEGALFDPSGERVLSWGLDGEARIWDVTTGNQIAASKKPEGGAGDGSTGVTGAAFDAAGKRVLSWTYDGIAQVWDAADGTEIAELRGVYEAQLDNAGRLVLSWGGEDRAAYVWDVATRKQIASLELAGGVDGALFDATGSRVLFRGGAPAARVRELATGKEVDGAQHEGGVKGALFDAAGERALSWGEDGVVRVWNASTGAEIARFKHELSVQGALFDATGERVLSWSSDGVARVWSATKGEEIARSQQPGAVKDATFDAEGKRVLSVSRSTVKVWDAATGSEIASSSHDGTVTNGARFDATGSRVISWGERRVWVWDAATGIDTASFGQNWRVIGARFDPSGKRALLWGFGVLGARIQDVSGSLPRASNRAFIDEVCAQRLHGTDAALGAPFVNGNGETISHDSVRRISRADAEFAPILRNRVGEDVCESPSR